MKIARFAALLLLATLAFRSVASQTGTQTFPAKFESRAAAEKYAKAIPTGGEIAELKIGARAFLILRVSGSGVLEIALAVYESTNDGWVYCSEWRGPTPEAHAPFVSDGAIMVRGARSNKEWLLFRPDEKKAQPIPAAKPPFGPRG